MKNVKLYLCVLFALVMASCSTDLVEVDTNKIDLKTKSMDLGENPVTLEDGILCFPSEAALKEVLSCMNDSNDILDLKNKEFKSIYTTFDQAMAEADNYYDSRENYEKYKQIYSSLYFPEYGDDYSAYLPVSDKKMAKLANAEGFIKVNGELVDCKDISSYATLDSLGLTPPNPKSRSSRIYYYEEGKNKLWVNFSTAQTINGQPDYASGLKLEVCFRKKGWLGWFNRKASSTLSCANCDIISAPTTDPTATNVGTPYKESRDGFSSHDHFVEPNRLMGGGRAGYYIEVGFGPTGGHMHKIIIKK